MNLGIQLWSLREQLKESPENTLRLIKDLGINIVEPTDIFEAKILQPIFKDLSLKTPSSFLAWSYISKNWQYMKDINYPWIPKNKSLEYLFEQASSLGINHIVNGYFPPIDRPTFSQWQWLTERLELVAQQAKQFDLTLCYHNHAFEFDLKHPSTNETAYEYLYKNSESLLFELDIMWSTVSQQSTLQLVSLLGPRLKLLHLKDSTYQGGALFDDQMMGENDFCALGQGVVDCKTIINAAKHVDYYYIEQDFSSDIYKDLQQSIQYFNSIKLR